LTQQPTAPNQENKSAGTVDADRDRAGKTGIGDADRGGSGKTGMLVLTDSVPSSIASWISIKTDAFPRTSTIKHSIEWIQTTMVI
jgi:hypothetical protein